MFEVGTELTTFEEVMFFDTDCGGVVHNLAYLRMIETCRTQLAAKAGMKLRDMAETKIFPVLTRTEIDYKKPAKLGDSLRLQGKLVDVGKVKFFCETKIYLSAEEPVLIATCLQTLALVQMPAGKPIRLSTADNCR